jgi:putative Ca2+/H+ antiporter (TMEM165/GDT1 family)
VTSAVGRLVVAAPDARLLLYMHSFRNGTPSGDTAAPMLPGLAACWPVRRHWAEPDPLGYAAPRGGAMDLKLFAAVFATIFLAELGDKTQLATLLYAADARSPKLTVFVAAASALALTSALGVVAGGWLSQHVSERVLRVAAGAGFIAIGVWTLLRD